MFLVILLHMKIEIDQSGKVEQTHLGTVVALSNDIQISVLLRKKEKRILQEHFRYIHKKNIFSYIVFAALVAYVLHGYSSRYKVTIDTEYTGHEALIKEYILKFLHHLKSPSIPPVIFSRVGKKSPADIHAGKVALGLIEPTKILKAIDIAQMLYLL